LHDVRTGRRPSIKRQAEVSPCPLPRPHLTSTLKIVNDNKIASNYKNHTF